jgi:hypothetical protein
MHSHRAAPLRNGAWEIERLESLSLIELCERGELRSGIVSRLEDTTQFDINCWAFVSRYNSIQSKVFSRHRDLKNRKEILFRA